MRIETVFALSYVYRMNKKAISLTLDPENVAWLETRAKKLGLRSISEAVDRLLSAIRNPSLAPKRSVVGTVKIASEDPGLLAADDYIRSLFGSLNHPRWAKRMK